MTTTTTTASPSPNPSPSPNQARRRRPETLGHFVVGMRYRAGGHGATLTWADGSSASYSARAVFRLEQLPVHVKGRVFRVDALNYETPGPVPDP